jgi:ribonuclease R
VILDRDCRVLSQSVCRSVIRSKQRLTYVEAQELIDNKKDRSERASSLRVMMDVSRGLRRHRLAKGALDLEIPENRIVFDAQGLPISLVPQDDSATHGMVEDYMLLANEAVAGMLLERYPGQAVFRVHGQPKLEELQDLCAAWKRPYYPTDPLRTINGLLEGLTDRKQKQIFGRLILRVLDRARYHPVNTGHFGLGLDKYTHFTSPIRRYPDLLVHRLLLAPKGKYVESGELNHICAQASELEERAQHLEWEADDLMACALMQNRVGEEFTGHVTGVIASGLFIILEQPPVEGRLAVRELKDDYYFYDESSLSLKGEKNRMIYKVGDRVAVKLAGVSLPRRQLDFKPAYRGNSFKL